MSYLLELLGRGLDEGIGQLLDRYFWMPQRKSLQQLEQLIQSHSDRADLHLQAGLAYLKSMQVDRAIEHLQQACRYAPDDLAGRLALTSAYEEDNQPARALECLTIANQIKPGEPPILFAIGFCHEKLGNPQRACEYYNDAIARDERFLQARQRLAAVALLLDQTDVALQQYQAIKDLLPDKGWIYAAIAQLHYRMGEYSKAVDEFEIALALEPENWSLADEQVEALLADGQIPQAIERLQELLNRQGPFADLHVRLGDAYSMSGDDAGALNHYHQALELQGDYLEASVKLATHHLSLGRWEEAAELFHRACDINDKLLLNYVGLGVVQESAGRHGEAMNAFELAATIEPNSALLMAEIAGLQLKAAVAEEFLRNFQVDRILPSDTPLDNLDNDDLLQKQIVRHLEQVSAHPDFADVRYRCGVLLRAVGRSAEAIEQFVQAVNLNPSYTQALIRLGICRQELGQTDQAIETFKRVLELAPKYVDVHYRLGLLYTDRREFAKAVKHMEEASTGSPGNRHIKAGLSLSLQNMGLNDRAAATWRSLWQLNNTHV